MREYRCANCKKLLFKYNPNAIFEILVVCPKCDYKKEQIVANYLLDISKWSFSVGSCK